VGSGSPATAFAYLVVMHTPLVQSAVRSAGHSLTVTRDWLAALRLTRACPSERGQALIEFAMLFPIILVFLLALVDFGMAMDQRQVVQHAVREGARHGAVGNSQSSIITLTENQMDGLTVDVCYVDGPNGEDAGRAGSFVRVSGSFDYIFTLGSGELLNAFGVSGPLTINMTPSADERLERSVTGADEC